MVGGAEAGPGPIGRPRSREVERLRYATELPGAPDGEYVVVEYATEFERKRNGSELVTLMREPRSVARGRLLREVTAIAVGLGDGRVVP